MSLVEISAVYRRARVVSRMAELKATHELKRGRFILISRTVSQRCQGRYLFVTRVDHFPVSPVHDDSPGEFDV